ncbi:MAG: hypothetical protein AB2693_13485 [Candidatus Thiodiazotropha sp.]
MVDRVRTLWVDIAMYKPLRVGSNILLPVALKKKAVITVKKPG